MKNFREIGRQAFLRGEPAAPALNPQVWLALDGLPVGSPEGIKIMQDFTAGWTAANLAAPVDFTEDI
jgi:hypothetical protein